MTITAMIAAVALASLPPIPNNEQATMNPGRAYDACQEEFQAERLERARQACRTAFVVSAIVPMHENERINTMMRHLLSDMVYFLRPGGDAEVLGWR